MQNDTLKKYFWLLLDAALAVIIINVVFFVMPAIQRFGSSFAPSRTMMVTAEGKTTVAPDTAELSFSVITQGKNPQDLSQNNTDKMNAAIGFVKSQGIDDKDIKTTGYNLSPNYSWDKNTNRNYIIGYTLTSTLSVKVSNIGQDLDKVAKIIGGLTPLGVNQIGGITFMVDDETAALSTARADAFSKAQEKAKEMASANGVRLGEIVNVAESNSGPMPYFRTDMLSGAGMGGVAAPAAPTLQPGTQDVTVQVSLTYALD